MYTFWSYVGLIDFHDVSWWPLTRACSAAMLQILSRPLTSRSISRSQLLLHWTSRNTQSDGKWAERVGPGPGPGGCVFYANIYPQCWTVTSSLFMVTGEIVWQKEACVGQCSVWCQHHLVWYYIASTFLHHHHMPYSRETLWRWKDTTAHIHNCITYVHSSRT